MSLLILDETEPLQTERGAIVVVIPVYGSHDRFVECIRGVLAHTPADIPVLVVDDASPDERSTEFLVRLDGHDALAHTVYCVKHKENKGFVATANEAFERCDPADVIVLNSDCVVTAGWLEAMRSRRWGVRSWPTSERVHKQRNKSVTSGPEPTRPRAASVARPRQCRASH